LSGGKLKESIVTGALAGLGNWGGNALGGKLGEFAANNFGTAIGGSFGAIGAGIGAAAGVLGASYMGRLSGEGKAYQNEAEDELDKALEARDSMINKYMSNGSSNSAQSAGGFSGLNFYNPTGSSALAPPTPALSNVAAPAAISLTTTAQTPIGAALTAMPTYNAANTDPMARKAERDRQYNYVNTIRSRLYRA
jgi:hypothetical protein